LTRLRRGTVMDRQERDVRKSLVGTATLFCVLLLAQTVWGDYLLTLRSGLQLRVRTYTIDGATIQLWTESGSMTLPIDIVMRITEHGAFPSSELQHSTAPSPAQAQNEETPAMHLDQGRQRSLYIPDEKSQPQ
jgi:hypothetical protein